MKFNKKAIVAGQEEAKVSNFNTDLFESDREPLEQFIKADYSEFHLVSVDHRHDKGEHDNLVESVVCVGKEDDFYLVTAVTTDFNGEVQHSYTQQTLTLKGFNYFTKEVSC